MQLYLGERGRGLGPCAVTMGNFDGVHLGHLAMLRALRTAADAQGLPTALLTFAPHPREVFQRDSPPARLTGLRDKLALLAASTYVDRVYVRRFNRSFAALSPDAFMDEVLLAQLDVRYLLVGEDFHFGACRAGNAATLAARAEWVTQIMPTVSVDAARVSSSRVRAALTLGDMAQVTRMLGHPYQISGRVHYGKKLGRTLGFPTANLALTRYHRALNGIFVVEVETPQGCFPGVASVGVNPTVELRKRAVLEVYLLDFMDDLYGRCITVRFLQRLRDEQHFAGLAALSAQIARDVEQARSYFTHLNSARHA